ncbi:MAG: hypothetical protein LUC47_06530 [Clostridiales bacterium]|nr:hypothetical protein [Clostridiales bacterium]
MLFHTFHSQTEREKCGGSAFLELQFCKLPARSNLEALVAVEGIDPWQNDSLYIHDARLFDREYNSVFDCGVYNNLKVGTVDLWGINYYPPFSIDILIQKTDAEKPLEYETLRTWLRKAKAYNGFYILGM